MSEPSPAWPDRWFEDYAIGDSGLFGSVTVDEDAIIEFGRQFDPQPFHVDPVGARSSVFGGLIASGWHTGALMMRLLVDGVLGPSSMGSPGLDQLLWLVPVRPGDTLTLRSTVDDVTPSRSRADRGFVKMTQEMINQDGIVAMRAVANMMLRRRTG